MHTDCCLCPYAYQLLCQTFVYPVQHIIDEIARIGIQADFLREQSGKSWLSYKDKAKAKQAELVEQATYLTEKKDGWKEILETYEGSNDLPELIAAKVCGLCGCVREPRFAFVRTVTLGIYAFEMLYGIAQN
jgi:hypothetical protein